MKQGQIKFTRNGISCKDVLFRKVIWEYICWFLAGKPNNHKIDTKGM